AADSKARDGSPDRLDPGREIDLDGEAPGAGQVGRLERRSDSRMQSLTPELAPGEKPLEQVAAEVGDEPDPDIDRQCSAGEEGNDNEDRAADRVHGARPADQVEAVE